MSQTKVKSGLISDQSITASKLDVTGNGTSGQVLLSDGDGSFSWGDVSVDVNGVGTTNYISKWLDSDTITNSVIYDNGTNVGIGNTNPLNKLHIGNTFTIDETQGSTYVANLGSPDTGGTQVVPKEIAFFTNHNGQARAERMRIDSNGNVGIGTSSPYAKLYVKSPVAQSITNDIETTTAGFVISGSDENMSLQFGLGGSTLNYGNWIQSGYDNGTPGSSHLLLNPIGGNVGIGTSSPVADSLTLYKSTYPYIYVQNSSSGTAASDGLRLGLEAGIEARLDLLENLPLVFRTNATERMRIDSSGNVGIGTSSPTQFVQIGSNFQAKKLYVAGSYNFGGVYIGAVNTNTGSTIEFVSHTGVTTGRSFRIGSNTDLYGSDKLVFEISNSTTTYGGLSYSPKMLLNSLGNLHVDGDVIAYSTTISDERLKDNIVTIDNALDKVCELRGVEYDWNASSRSGQHDMGVIAQEVEKVFPFIVREKEMPLVDGNTYKTVDYEKLVGVLIEAVKELKQEIEILKSK